MTSTGRAARVAFVRGAVARDVDDLLIAGEVVVVDAGRRIGRGDSHIPNGQLRAALSFGNRALIPLAPIMVPMCLK